MGLQSSFKVQLVNFGEMQGLKDDMSQMRQCEKCRKQILAKDLAQHMETCQQIVVHTAQTSQTPKIIDFTSLSSQPDASGKQSQRSVRPVRKPRIASAKPPLVQNKDIGDNRPIKTNNVPKWKQESEQLRRAMSRSATDSTN